jgi:DNA processing protein
VRFCQLLDIFPQLGDLFRAPVTTLNRLGLPEGAVTAIQKPNWALVERQLRWAEALDRHIISYRDAAYPMLLKQTAASPPLLFVQGDLQWLSAPQIGVVGSRNPTQHGIDTARRFSQQLAQADYVITSGLALGIDAVSHQSTLAVGQATVAVLGCGLDRIYPARHRALAEQVAANGALVSEYMLGTAPLPENFPQRNRIVSGLSLGVLVVEATLRSGSLITARLAAEQGREVFAIPGSIYNSLARGCHALIKQGAKLVETVDDILEELPARVVMEEINATTAGMSAATSKHLSEEDQQVLAVIDYQAISVDQIIERTRLSAAVVAASLFMLELQGLVVQMVGGYCLAVN